MQFRNWIVSALLGVATLPAAALAGVIGGTYYAPQYDYREFYSIADNRNFQVVLAGTAFPGVDPAAVARDLLPAMQAAKPMPRLTFTYDPPAEKPRPDYRLYLIFDPANDLGSDSVCKGVTRFKPGRPGVLYMFAVYCRNDVAMSETTAWTNASGPTDPRIGELFRQLFQVVFSDSPALRPQNGGADRR